MVFKEPIRAACRSLVKRDCYPERSKANREYDSLYAAEGPYLEAGDARSHASASTSIRPWRIASWKAAWSFSVWSA